MDTHTIFRMDELTASGGSQSGRYWATSEQIFDRIPPSHGAKDLARRFGVRRFPPSRADEEKLANDLHSYFRKKHSRAMKPVRMSRQLSCRRRRGGNPMEMMELQVDPIQISPLKGSLQRKEMVGFLLMVVASIRTSAVRRRRWRNLVV